MTDPHIEKIKQRLRYDAGFVSQLALTNGMSEEQVLAKAALFMPDPDAPAESPEQE